MNRTAETEAVGGWTLADLHAANIARQAEWCPDQVPDLSFRGNELGGECGEAQNVIKKLERERQGWRGSRATLDDLAKELADVVICADLCAVTAGIDLYAAVQAKFNATSEKVGLSTMLATRPPAPQPAAEDEDHCIACDLVLRNGDMVHHEKEGGYIHAECAGPDRDGYHINDEPLGPNDPIPEPFAYETDATWRVRRAAERAEALQPAATEAVIEALSEARSGLLAFTGGHEGACGATIAKIDLVLATFAAQPATNHPEPTTAPSGGEAGEVR